MPEKWEARLFEGERGKLAIFPELCKGCGLCLEKCPDRVLRWSEVPGVTGNPTVEPEVEHCRGCGVCEDVCPDAAIAFLRQGRRSF